MERTAKDAYMESMAKVTGNMEVLQGLLDKFYSATTKCVNWGHVGTINHIAELLDNLISEVRTETPPTE